MKAVILDKDGTLVDNSGYPEIIPSDGLYEQDVLEGLKHLQERGYKLLIFSNQSWISKGRMTEQQVENVFHSLLIQLNNHGIRIHDYYYCPHKAADACACRKPKPQILNQIIQEHGLDKDQCYFVGDMVADIGAGKNAGIKTILVQTGRGKHYSAELEPDHRIENVNAIHTIIP
jgi:D-glycero-D-manno-heptose 1,7-bisphosphate phosphatase